MENYSNENNNMNELQNTQIIQKSNEYNDEPFIEKDHKGIKTFIIIAIILLLLGGASFFYYLKIYNNPMIVIGNIFKETKSSFKISNTQNTNAYKISGLLDLNLKFNDQETQKLADIINDIKLQYNVSIDNNNNYGVMELYSKYQEDKLLNIKAILDNENETAYVYLEDLFDKYLKTTINVTSESTSTENINYEVIINSIYDALSSAIQEEDFKRVSDKTIINEKTTKVYKNSIIINQDNYKRIMTTLIKDLRDNEEFIKEINKLNNNEDIKETFNEELNEINELSFEDIIEINFYTKPSLKQELLKLEIVEINENGNYNVAFTKTNETKFTVDIKENNEQIATININKNSDSNIIINCNLNIDGNEIELTLNASYEELNRIEKIDTTPNVDINNLKEDDTTKIYTNLMENKGLLNLINDINNIFALNM